MGSEQSVSDTPGIDNRPLKLDCGVKLIVVNYILLWKRKHEQGIGE